LLRASESAADPVGHLCVPKRVEPNMRVDREALILRCTLPQPESLEEIDRVGLRALERVLQCGLEARADVEDDVSGADAFDVPRGQLDVVRLGSRRREVHHVYLRAADLLGCVGERIEGSHDRRRTPALTIAAGAASTNTESDYEYENYSRYYKMSLP
jgi:hypothetical protein